MENFEKFAAECASDAIAVIDSRSYCILYSNQRFQLLGRYKLDAKTDYFEYILGANSGIRNRISSQLKRGLKFQESIEIDTPLEQKIKLEVNFIPYYGDNHDQVSIWTAVHRREVHGGGKKELLESVEWVSGQLNLVLSSAPLALWTIDLDKTICSFMGQKADAVVENRLGAIHHNVAEVFAEVPAMLQAINDATAKRIKQAIVRHKECVFEHHFSPLKLKDDSTIGLVIVSVDITEQVKTQQSLVAAKQKAEEAAFAKTRFLANISHEIRTPLNAILGFSQLISDQIENPEIIKYIQSIRSNGENLLNLINDLLDLSQIESGMIRIEKKDVSITKLLIEVSNIFSFEAIKKNIPLVVKNELKFDLIKSDELRLKQILVNLVGNAYKYTNQGQITIRCYMLENTGSLCVDVKDTGIGIKPTDLEKLFQPFSQVSDENRGGVGLGLSIAKKLAENLNGYIDLESEFGKGSVFRIILKNIEYNTLIEKNYHKRESSTAENVHLNNLSLPDDILTPIKDAFREDWCVVMETPMPKEISRFIHKLKEIIGSRQHIGVQHQLNIAEESLRKYDINASKNALKTMYLMIEKS